jgi:hypothetical protein
MLIVTTIGCPRCLHLPPARVRRAGAPVRPRSHRTAGGQLGSTMANSSPPMRATRSIGRTLSTSAVATALQHQVAGGMAVGVVDALEVVDVQRSAAARGSPLRATRSTSRASASSKLRRLASPVSTSRLDRSTSASIRPCSQAGLPGSPAGAGRPDCASNCSACSRCSGPGGGPVGGSVRCTKGGRSGGGGSDERAGGPR